MIITEQSLHAARMALQRAQKETQDSFMRYTSCLDLERQARQAVLMAEKRRDDIGKSLAYHPESTISSFGNHSVSDSAEKFYGIWQVMIPVVLWSQLTCQ
jgi:anthranilate/para-aminobenzoate synthase component II